MPFDYCFYNVGREQYQALIGDNLSGISKIFVYLYKEKNNLKDKKCKHHLKYFSIQELPMNLMVHLEMNENAWSEATTNNARRLTLDSRRIFKGVEQ